jgi:hypothetical protein
MKLIRWKVNCGGKKRGEKSILSDTDTEYFKDYVIVLKDLGKYKGKKKIVKKNDYVRINKEDLSDLISFLLAREIDIALEIENFGSLKRIFRRLFNRNPKSG